MSDSIQPQRTKRPRGSINALKLVNQLREELGLPKVTKHTTPKPKKPQAPKITRQMVAEICIAVWKEKYPSAISDANYTLGELTVALVQQEVERRIAILKGDLIPIGGRRPK